MKYSVFVVLLLLATAVGAQALELSSFDYEPREKVSSLEKEKLTPEYDTDLVFKSLNGNTLRCERFCYSQFVFYNNLPYTVDLADLQVETYTVDLKNNIDAVKEVRWDVSDGKAHPLCKNDDLECMYTYEGYKLTSEIPNEIRYVLPGETRTIKLMGEKADNVDVEWMPTLKLQKTKYKTLPVNEVVLRQTDWALWLKGDNVYTNGLLAFYKLDETSGTTATDSSGNGYDGATTDATVNQAGVFSKAYSFDGDNDYVTVCDEPTCTYSKTMCDNGCTFCAWTYFEGDNVGADSFLARYDATDNNAFLRFYYDARITQEKYVFIIYNNGTAADGSSSIGSSTNSFPIGTTTNTWRHLCGVFNGTTTEVGYNTLYINGISYGTSNSGITIQGGAGGWGDDEDLFIGLNDDSSLSNEWDGKLDQVLIYNLPLTDTEVLKLYEAGVTTGKYNNPLEGSIYTTDDNITLDVDVGVNSGLINLTYTAVDGTDYLLYDGTVHNQTSIFLDMINASVWNVHGSDTPLQGAQTIKVDAWGGSTSDLVTQWNPTLNITFNPPSYPGTCTTQKGLNSSLKMATGLTVKNEILNFTNFHEYCSDTNCNNIKIYYPEQRTCLEGGGCTTLPEAPTETYKLDGADYTLVVNRSLVYGSYNIYIGGYNYNNDYSTYTGSLVNTQYHQLNLSSFQPATNAYFVSAHYEEDDLPIDPEQLDTATMKMYCANYAPYTINLKYYNNRDTFLITTNEMPHIETKLTNGTYSNTRKKAALTNWGNVTTYNLREGTDIVTYYFILADYTGTQRKNGYLDIRANVNGSLQTVYREKWYFQQIYNVTLQKDADYQILTLIPDTSTINYGWVNFGFITPSSDSYKTLTVTQPIIDTITDHYEGLYYRYLHSTTPFVLGYAYNFTTESTINWVRFRVYNSSNQVVYSTNASTPNGQLTWSSGNENSTYRTTLEWDVDDHSYDSIENIYKGAFQTLLKVRKGLDLDNISLLGFEGVKIEKFMSWFLIMFVGLIASAGNFGLVAIVVMLMAGFTSLIGWLPDIYFYILVGGTAVMAVGSRLMNVREKKGVT